MAITCKKVIHSHIPALSAMARATFTANFGHLYAPEHLAAHLEKTCSEVFFEQELKNGSHVIIARDGDTLVGYIKFGKVGLPTEHRPDDAELHRLYVIESHQKSGIGKQLVEAALADPYLQQSPAIYVGVWENNFRAQKFYASYGFVPVGEYGYQVGPHVDREFILRRG